MEVMTFVTGDDPICRVSINGEMFAHLEARAIANRILQLADKAESDTKERIRAAYDN